MKSIGRPVLLILLLSSLSVEANAIEAQGWLSDCTERQDKPFHCGDILRPPPALATMNREKSQNLTYTLAVYYALPSDIPFDQEVFNRIREASLEIQAWYQVATGGVTWEWAYPEIVRVYQGQETRQFYKSTGNWWGSLLPEMDSAGLPVREPGIVISIWAQGAEWWAGAAQDCGLDCGVALLGVELFPQFNNPVWTGQACPDPDGQGVEAWPCTPVGAYAHELGHTMGLIHPLDDPVTAPYAWHSIMQTHWNYPNEAPPEDRPWGFLRSERQRIGSNPFMKTGVPLVQVHQDADIAVNLPVSGTLPLANFNVEVAGNEARFSNSTQRANLYYWTFGDYEASNIVSPTHMYLSGGVYTVTLRASSDLAMMSVVSRTIVIDMYPHDKVFLPVVIRP